MAVYTDITEAELGAFLREYGIGDLLSYRGIAEGTENSNFSLHTTQGPYLLTLYEKRVEAADLPFFLGLMEHLAARGLPVPLPVRRRDGEMIGQVAGRPAARSRCMELVASAGMLSAKARVRSTASSDSGTPAARPVAWTSRMSASNVGRSRVRSSPSGLPDRAPSAPVVVTYIAFSHTSTKMSPRTTASTPASRSAAANLSTTSCRRPSHVPMVCEIGPPWNSICPGPV
mgnify:CR=1 FL=1